MPAVSTIVALLAALYAARVGLFMIGFRRQRTRWRTALYTPSVTIVVPARNEEATLERCITSLMRVDYPASLRTVVVVDDRSTDGTAQVLQRLASEFAELRVVSRTNEDVERNLRGKPGALQHGIDASAGELILMTDADCSVSPGWVRGMVQQFSDPNVGLVAGLTSITGPTLFDRIQDVEWTYTQAMAAGGIGLGIPLGCFGNNLAVRRDAFEQVGGYRRISFSVTEDLALQQAIHDAGWRVRHAIHEMTSVESLPARSLREYITQRHRWVRGGTSLGWRAVAFVATSVALWLALALALSQTLWWWVVALLLLRIGADGLLISTAVHAVGRYRLLPFIPMSVVVLMITELFLPFLVLKKNVTWKNQVFRP